MKKYIVLGSLTMFSLMSCGGASEPTETVTEEVKMEIVELENETQILEETREDIEASTKELETLLEEL